MGRKWTLVERRAASEKAKARIAAQPVATAVAERPPEPEPSENEEALDSDNVLAQLAGLFQQASGQRSGRDKAITEALDVLGKLDPRKYPEIADNPAVQDFVEKVQAQRAQSSDVPPGTIMGTGLASFKKPWTKNDLLKGKDMPVEEARARGFMEWITYRPMHTTVVIWQGIKVHFMARRPIYTPKCFADVYEDSLAQQDFAERHAAWLFNTPGVQVDPAFFTTNAPRVKAMDQSKGEYYVPGGGEISLAPSPDLVAMGGGGSEEAA